MKFTKIEHPAYGEVYVLNASLKRAHLRVYSTDAELQKLRKNIKLLSGSYNCVTVFDAYEQNANYIDAAIAYSSNLEKFIEILSGPYKRVSMTDEEDDMIKNKIIDIIVAKLTSRYSELSYNSEFNVRRIYAMRYRLYEEAFGGNTIVQKFLRQFYHEIVSRPELKEDPAHIYDDLRKVFADTYKTYDQSHPSADRLRVENILKTIKMNELYIHDDFELYYNALADEYNLPPRYKTINVEYDLSSGCAVFKFDGGASAPCKDFVAKDWSDIPDYS